MRARLAAEPLLHAAHPFLLSLLLPLLASHLHAALSAPVREEQRAREATLSPLETPETLEKVRFLMQDNLNPALDIWHTKEQQRNGAKLTMNNFFRTAGFVQRQPIARDMGSFWGIKNNRLFRPNRDGPARYDPIIMAQEHKPNKDSAEWSLLSMWLALEEAIEAGVQFPDVLFLFNGGDQPMCNKFYSCEYSRFDYEHAPPLSVVGYNSSLLPPEHQMNGYTPTGQGDLLVPHFRFTGHSMAFSIHPHHPLITSLFSKGDPLWSSKRNATRNVVPWEQKIPKLFFRGKAWCSYMKKHGCPRTVLTNLTIDYPDDMDVWSNGARLNRPARRALRFLPMSDWSKYKYLAALDGIGASSRTITLYHLGSVVMKQWRTAYVEWFYQSLKPDVHHVHIFQTDEDTAEVVKQLKANDTRAREIAEAGTSFAKNYLVKDVMMVYLKALLQGYRDLFEDMDEYMGVIGDTGNTSLWRAHTTQWRQDWRLHQPPAEFVPILPRTGMFSPIPEDRQAAFLRRPFGVYHPENRSFTGGNLGIGTDRYVGKTKRLLQGYETQNGREGTVNPAQ